MRVLLVGADFTPPWTEGRKNFVRDLAPRLAARLDVRLLTTGVHSAEVREPCAGRVVAAQTKWQQLAALERALGESLATWQPDAVCHFPFGTFHGVRGWANVRSMRRIDRLSARRGVRCLTILYSITRGSRAALSRRVRELVLAAAPGWTGLTLTFGSDFTAALRIVPKSSPTPTVLFMAGAHTATRQTLEYVLHERGLEDVITAAGELAAAGVRVMVAIPALREAAWRDELSRRFAERAANLDLDLRDHVSVPGIFAETDLYLFPYRVDLEQFVPTSILEAMAAGAPVVLSDLAMLAPLANDGRTAYVYRHSDGHHLAAVALAALADQPARLAHASAARIFVQREWSIDRSVAELMAILERPVRAAY